MKRNKLKWMFLWGVLGILTCTFALPNMRSLVIGFAQTKYVEWKLAQLEPRNEEELWSAYSDACRLGVQYYSLFKVDGKRVVHRWTRDASGTIKPWVKPSLEELFVSCLSGEGAWMDQDVRILFTAGHRADATWKFSRWKIWLEIGLAVIGGLAASWLGMLLLYLLIVGLIGYVLLTGRIPSVAMHVSDGRPTINAVDIGGDDDPHVDDAPPDIPTSRNWSLVLVLVAVVVVADWRRVIARIRSVGSRAPPFRTEGAMLRIIVLAVVSSFFNPGPVQAGQSLTATFGEWSSSRGSRVIWSATLPGEYLTSKVLLRLDGTSIEDGVSLGLRSGKFRASFGPALGWISDSNGAALFGGAQVDAGWGDGSTAVSTSFLGRYRRSARLFELGTVSIGQRLGRVSVAAIWQPLRRAEPWWDHRVAGRIQLATPRVSIGLEARRSLTNERTSANIEFVVPLKK